jgi:hypothetical protein
MDKETVRRKLGIIVSLLSKAYEVRGLNIEVHGNNLAARIQNDAVRDVQADDLNFTNTVGFMAGEIKRLDVLKGVKGSNGQQRQYESLKDMPDDVFKRSLMGGDVSTTHGNTTNSERSIPSKVADGHAHSSTEYGSISDVPDDVFARSFKQNDGGGFLSDSY